MRRHQPPARSIAHRYRFSSVPCDDLEQAAYFGLLKAIRRCDPHRGCAFSTIAVPTIIGEVKRQCAELARFPRVPDIASRIGCHEERLIDALAAASTLNMTGQAARLFRHPVGHLTSLANQADRPLIAASGAGPGRACPSGR